MDIFTGLCFTPQALEKKTYIRNNISFICNFKFSTPTDVGNTDEDLLQAFLMQNSGGENTPEKRGSKWRFGKRADDSDSRIVNAMVELLQEKSDLYNTQSELLEEKLLEDEYLMSDDDYRLENKRGSKWRFG